MRLPLALTTAAVAFAFAAGPAQADSSVPTQHPRSPQGVVVLIGANDYGVVAPAQGFTPPIGTEWGSVTAATPTRSNGIIAVLIG